MNEQHEPWASKQSGTRFQGGGLRTEGKAGGLEIKKSNEQTAEPHPIHIFSICGAELANHVNSHKLFFFFFFGPTLVCFALLYPWTTEGGRGREGKGKDRQPSELYKVFFRLDLFCLFVCVHACECVSVVCANWIGWLSQWENLLACVNFFFFFGREAMPREGRKEGEKGRKRRRSRLFFIHSGSSFCADTNNNNTLGGYVEDDNDDAVLSVVFIVFLGLTFLRISPTQPTTQRIFPARLTNAMYPIATYISNRNIHILHPVCVRRVHSTWIVLKITVLGVSRTVVSYHLHVTLVSIFTTIGTSASCKRTCLKKKRKGY